ncbi:MAG: SDR family oxidoreductase [Prevotella sp.]|nr:SDR family oxidoreductase [Prevotella sp.]
MKYALVTGGTKGIGLAIVRMLMKEGYFVILTYSNDDSAMEVCRKELSLISPNFRIVKADQGDKEQYASLLEIVKSYPSLSCIVFNVGITLRKGLTDIEDAEWLHVMNVNVNIPVFMLRDLHEMIPHNSRIIFIGSEMGIYPHGTSLAYGVSKSAVHALAQNLVKFYENTGTTVNAIAPGFVETEWQARKNPEIKQNICNKTAAKRFATADEIADAVRFCINNAFVNGSIIEVNGGYCYK